MQEQQSGPGGTRRIGWADIMRIHYSALTGAYWDAEGRVCDSDDGTERTDPERSADMGRSDEDDGRKN
jgi:hypothetical protein